VVALVAIQVRQLLEPLTRAVVAEVALRVELEPLEALAS
jgi:hypothetical protein